MVVNTTYGVQADPDVAIFTGIACSWEVNSNNIRIRPGAFRKAIQGAEAERKAHNGRMLWPILWEHKPEQAFGGITFTEEREDGLYVEGFLDPLTPECQTALQKAKTGKVNGLSIGFEVIVEHKEGTVRVIDQLELYEISVGACPVDNLARLKVKKFSELEYAMMRAVNQESESEKMASNVGWIDDDEEVSTELSPFQRAWYGDNPPQPYTLQWGAEEESRAAFEREWRAELRAEDDIWTLGDKNRIKELQKREKERRGKQQQQHAALLADRKARAEARPDMTQDWTPEAFAQKMGLDPAWMRRLFAQYVASGAVKPVNADTLTLRGSDIQRIARQQAEAFEFQAIKARNKRAAERAA